MARELAPTGLRSSPKPHPLFPQTHPTALRERLNAALKYLNLMACTCLTDYAENDINTVTNIARIMVQDTADVFGVIEQRGFEKPKAP